MMKNKTYWLLFISIVLIAAFALCYDLLFPPKTSLSDKDIKLELEKRERILVDNKEVDECVFVVSKHYEAPACDEVLTFVKICIELGVNDTPDGRLINFWMGDCYAKQGKNN